MSSSSSSSSSKSKPRFIHDVFINFRGVNTRRGFVSHLYPALSNAGVNAFLDDEKLQKGKTLGPELLGAIGGSQIAIVVLSKDYATSRWCLDELVEIMKCHTARGQLVLPVFYDVSPSSLRPPFGKGSRVDTRLEREWIRQLRMPTPINVEWKEALTNVCNMVGWDVTKCRSEKVVVDEIVSEVLKKVDRTYLSDPVFPVGLESCVQHITRRIRKRKRGVCMVGIWGMGGIGKTTIAKSIYNELRHEFEDKSFLENVREGWETTMGQINLQEQLLFDMLKTKNIKVYTTYQGKYQIKEALHNRKALIVLDDVDHSDQLKALLCDNVNEIGPRNVIIFTTRNKRLLVEFGVEVEHVYPVEGLNESESFKLFNWHAFKEASPKEDFIELSRNVVAYCKGLPLALTALGSHLYRRSKDQWESALLGLKRIPNDDIQEKLKISYDGLKGPMVQGIFLDICYFFIGKNKMYATTVLNDCSNLVIENLVERSLIEVDEKGKLRMHDLLRDMGREIVCQSSPVKPENRSRLWGHDAFNVLKEHKGTRTIEGLVLKLGRKGRGAIESLTLESPRKSGNWFATQAFVNMERLGLLQFKHVQLFGNYQYLPSHLRWVYWKGLCLKYVPDNFYLGNVVALDLKHSNLKLLWKNPQLLERLKILNLSHSSYLRSTPDFSKLPNLEKLILKCCSRLSKVHHSIGDLSNILLINLEDCENLSNLPIVFYKLKSVETLILSGCSKIDKLEDVVQMESLKTLIAKDKGVNWVPFSILRSNIGFICLHGYEGLACDVFPSLIWCWMSPREYLVSYNQSFGSMSTYLISIGLQDNNLGDLLSILGGLSKLRSIKVQCNLEFLQSEKLRRILHDLCDVNFTKLVTTSYASQNFENSLRSLLIGMGSYKPVIENIAQGLTTNGSSNFNLPGGNYPLWLAYMGEGHSVSFQVPGDSDCPLKGMILCVVYPSSALKHMAVECLTSISIINYTKCCIQMYTRDAAMSFNNEDWQGMSNLGPGDNVEIFVTFGRELTVMQTTVYLIYDQSIIMEMEPSSNVNVHPQLDVQTESTRKPKKNILTKLGKKIREWSCLSRHNSINSF